MHTSANKPSAGRESRRRFIKRTSAATAVLAAANLLPARATAANQADGISLVLDPADEVAIQEPVKWAVAQFQNAAKSRGLPVSLFDRVEKSPKASLCVVVAGRSAPAAMKALVSAGVAVPEVPEALGLVRGRMAERPVLLACGANARGLVYALLELTDRVTAADDPLASLRSIEKIVERPANVIRSAARLFTSDVEDKPWFNDRAFWDRYLTMLVTERFNRFNLTLGIGYDFTTSIRDCYFHFAYPFLLAVPGYEVRAEPLPDTERAGNLEMLRFISGEAARRGLHFQLGLWTHAYQWTNSPNANYLIKGLTPETHAAYCRDAMEALLRACPAISGVTFRIHGESGVAEGNYDFWRTIFDGAVRCGRRVEIDLHAKGIDDGMIETALATGLPVNISPKFWAEHQGLGYLQGAIRPLEMPPREAADKGFFSKSNGSRRFLRYGYGDLLAENRRYGVLHRVWPGTQRLLLWGDPHLAAAYGRAWSFCGSLGFELCEPLSFKGRKGSGLPGGRDAYADASLRAPGGDFEKYRYTYRLWGRLSYNPDADPECWQRLLRRQYGAGADAAEKALSLASRILPLVTTAHCPSAANNNYWPELYTNMPVVDASRPHPYSDTPSPKRFGAVSPLDPEFFSRIDDFAGELIQGAHSAKHSPAEVAQWLQALAEQSVKHLAGAEATLAGSRSLEFRRLALDVNLQCGLGLFFAWKFRAGVLYALYERSRNQPALQEALKAYRAARTAWSDLANRAGGAYVRDITFGYDKHLRGHWLDRLPAIDQDIADLEKRLGQAPEPGKVDLDPGIVERAIRDVLAPAPRPEGRLEHTPPAALRRGQDVVIETALASAGRGRTVAIHLHYRHVDQAEIFQVTEMRAKDGVYRAEIPAAYADSPFPLEYYFELRDPTGAAWLHPGFNADLANQPYYVVRR